VAGELAEVSWLAAPKVFHVFPSAIVLLPSFLGQFLFGPSQLALQWQDNDPHWAFFFGISARGQVS
jgi:hypothetical protein